MAVHWNFGIGNASEAVQKLYAEDQKKTAIRRSELSRLRRNGDFAGAHIKEIKYRLKDAVELLKKAEAEEVAATSTSANDFSFIIVDADAERRRKEIIEATRSEIERLTKQLADAIEKQQAAR